MKSSEGFTLLELLVVVTMMMMLMVATAYSFLPALAKSRDTRRFQDIRDLQKALNLSYISNKKYPTSLTEISLHGTDPVNSKLLTDQDLLEKIVDPLSGDTDNCGAGNTCNYYYQTNGGGTSYQIRFCLETDGAKGFAKGCSNYMKP